MGSREGGGIGGRDRIFTGTAGRANVAQRAPRFDPITGGSGAARVAGNQLVCLALLHLLKLCVGIDGVDQLAQAQASRLARLVKAGEEPRLRHLTRHGPLRTREILDGGSIYWIIRGFVQVRQRILAIDRLRPPEGGKHCALVLDAVLIRTRLQPRRPHQGWRYLEPADAPAELDPWPAGVDDLPAELAAQLRRLGLL